MPSKKGPSERNPASYVGPGVFHKLSHQAKVGTALRKVAEIQRQADEERKKRPAKHKVDLFQTFVSMRKNMPSNP
jgi:hypothetical protein